MKWSEVKESVENIIKEKGLRDPEILIWGENIHGVDSFEANVGNEENVVLVSD